VLDYRAGQQAFRLPRLERRFTRNESTTMIIPALLLAAAQTAAPARPAPAAPPQQAAPAHARLKQLGFSDAGLAALRRVETARAAEFRQAAVGLRAVNDEIRALVAATAVDPARLGAALRRRDSLRATVASLETNRLLEVLQALSPSDRAILVRNIGLVRAPRPAAAQPPRSR